MPIDGKEIDKAYQDNGDLVKKNLRFGYFFLAEDPSRPLYPAVQNRELVYGEEKLPETKFQNNYIKSFASTVITPDAFAAQEGSLHEVECITPAVAVGSPMYLVGHLFAKRTEDETQPQEKDVIVRDKSLLNEVIQSMQIGGERRYGFGRISLCNDQCQKVNKILTII